MSHLLQRESRMAGLDIDSNGTLDPGVTDRISARETEYAMIEGD